ncbi:hypothetical protein CDAR_247511 [Caerostris darwini]|uniref:Uncharacterized protein n=1 Tax=Caerostris darwini TaxID=1538125 RepID=A0AAV4RBX7_9ARAC|nr:hypothetical protein CDAR_247511 [Caerostris darwini]
MIDEYAPKQHNSLQSEGGNNHRNTTTTTTHTHTVVVVNRSQQTPPVPRPSLEYVGHLRGTIEPSSQRGFWPWFYAWNQRPESNPFYAE